MKKSIFFKFKLCLIMSITLISLISSCGGGGGGGNSNNSPASQPTNLVPTANAGDDQTVTEQILVHLYGSGSDSDGSIASYSWTQTAGASVKMHASESAEISFDAPAAKAQSTLSFLLTVKDNNGAASSDQVDIIVTSNPVPKSDIWEPSLQTECTAGQNSSPVMMLISG